MFLLSNPHATPIDPDVIFGSLIVKPETLSLKKEMVKSRKCNSNVCGSIVHLFCHFVTLYTKIRFVRWIWKMLSEGNHIIFKLNTFDIAYVYIIPMKIVILFFM